MQIKSFLGKWVFFATALVCLLLSPFESERKCKHATDDCHWYERPMLFFRDPEMTTRYVKCLVCVGLTLAMVEIIRSTWFRCRSWMSNRSKKQKIADSNSNASEFTGMALEFLRLANERLERDVERLDKKSVVMSESLTLACKLKDRLRKQLNCNDSNYTIDDIVIDDLSSPVVNDPMDFFDTGVTLPESVEEKTQNSYVDAVDKSISSQCTIIEPIKIDYVTDPIVVDTSRSMGNFWIDKFEESQRLQNITQEIIGECSLDIITPHTSSYENESVNLSDIAVSNSGDYRDAVDNFNKVINELKERHHYLLYGDRCFIEQGVPVLETVSENYDRGDLVLFKQVALLDPLKSSTEKLFYSSVANKIAVDIVVLSVIEILHSLS